LAYAGNSEEVVKKEHNPVGRLILAVGLLLLLVTPALADTARCTTREDAQAQRWVTTCTDGSRAVTKYDAPAQRWRTDAIRKRQGDKSLQGSPMPGKTGR